ncbi:MAG: phenylacetate--CoA ligase family protein [Anaerolineae bacterium]
MFWNKEAETMSRKKLEALQLQRLQELVERVYKKVPFYKKVFDESGLKPGDIKSLEDLSKLPFTTKDDLRDNYPFGLFTVPLDDVVRIHASSGTTGKPTVGGYTRGDMDLWAEVMARTLAAGGVTAKDVVHNAYGYGLFTGGLGFALGSETIGATTVPISGGLTKRQLMLMEDFGATVLCCTPSYALVLAEAAAEDGIDVRKRMKLRVGFFGAEPWSDKMREEIEAKWGLEAYDIYGLTEVIGPGVSIECEHHNGLHIFEDHFLAELIDPDTGERLPYGEEGELVFTTLTKEAIPVIRYRTKDRVRLDAEPCPCGRTLARMSKVTGRTDDMLIIRGVNVFPSQIESALLRVDGLAPQYLIFVDRPKDKLDRLEIWVEASEESFAKGEYWVKEIEQKANREVREVLGITAEVKVVEPKKVERSMGKAVRVVDKRKL